MLTCRLVQQHSTDWAPHTAAAPFFLLHIWPCTPHRSATACSTSPERKQQYADKVLWIWMGERERGIRRAYHEIMHLMRDLTWLEVSRSSRIFKCSLYFLKKTPWRDKDKAADSPSLMFVNPESAEVTEAKCIWLLPWITDRIYRSLLVCLFYSFVFPGWLFFTC